MELTKQRLTSIVIATFIIMGFGLYFFLYRPVIQNLRIKSSTCQATERELAQARKNAATLEVEGQRNPFIAEGEVSFALDELSQRGRTNGISFTSITPQQIVASEGGPYRVLPIEIETESSYQALGRFLGSLDGLEKSLVTVESLSVLSVNENPAQLRARLIIHMYLAA